VEAGAVVELGREGMAAISSASRDAAFRSDSISFADLEEGFEDQCNSAQLWRSPRVGKSANYRSYHQAVPFLAFALVRSKVTHL
jgi:hypothetical protein